MNASRTSGIQGITPVVYLLGVTFITVYVILTQTFVQHHWMLRMDHILLFLGQDAATPAEIGSLLLLQWLFAGIVLALYESAGRRRGWILVSAVPLVLFFLLVTIPEIITWLIVWPAFLVDAFIGQLQSSLGIAQIMLKFVLIVGVHGVALMLLYRFAKSPSLLRFSRLLQSRFRRSHE